MVNLGRRRSGRKHMAKKDPRIDAYIAKAEPFARPILKHLRKMVHSGCPDVEETMKWSMPHFDYQGMLCHMAAFKQHCAFGFWNDSILADRHRVAEKDAMGNFGRIRSLADLPPDDVLLDYVRKATQLNDSGVKRPTEKKTGAPKAALPIPGALAAALKMNKKAQAAFDSFSPSHRREYVEWITEAKRDATREARLATALEWIAEGKTRNWKYLPKRG